ncbi:FDFT1 [Branchiostoma lanceolatum]|uniref:Squalene synthase n=1 Tax=Branchiostoma lanceolatum TaxID=7740 RepID=A0A8J9Z5U6_BRALA|nr:FDFT1 [Branchiostoma lanceolatum]
MDLMRSALAGHPEEIYSLLKFKLGGCETVQTKCHYDQMCPSMRTCYQYLNQTSRSFAAVTQALDGDLRDAVCIFYLVLRALDTVEDDMTIPLDTKLDMLHNFYTYLQDPAWRFMDSNEKDKMVLEDFPTISQEFRKLKPLYQEVISDICRRMGAGMAEFVQRSDVDTLADWDKYCHYVAGLVGIGLSRLFSGSEFEDQLVGEDTDLANSMGLFLQKTNIIRDYLEDQVDGREFWPRQVWSKHANKLSDFRQSEMSQNALWCLNELVTNALLHVPDVMKYMSRLRNQSVFNFCAIPQVMAIATLARCYNNPKVFQGVVKIRKGEAVKMMINATNMENFRGIMRPFCEEIFSKMSQQDPSYSVTMEIVETIRQLTETKHNALTIQTTLSPLHVSCVLVVAAMTWQYWTQIHWIYEHYLDWH